MPIFVQMRMGCPGGAPGGSANENFVSPNEVGIATDRGAAGGFPNKDGITVDGGDNAGGGSAK
jgi:hypothetical protein